MVTKYLIELSGWLILAINGCSWVDDIPVGVCMMNYDNEFYGETPYHSLKYQCKDGIAYQLVWKTERPNYCDLNLNYSTYKVQSVLYNCDDDKLCDYYYVNMTQGNGTICDEHLTSIFGLTHVINVCYNYPHSGSYKYICNETSWATINYQDADCKSNNFSTNIQNDQCFEDDSLPWMRTDIVECSNNSNVYNYNIYY